MPSEPAAQADSVPPHVRLIEMGTASWITMIIHGAARIGLADHFDGGKKTAEELAGPTGTHAPSLRRLMRTLAGLGVLVEGPPGEFALTPLGEALKSGAPGSARASILSLAGDRFWRSMGEFPYALQTGKPAHVKAHGLPLFDWLTKHPEEAALFSETMMGFHGREPAALAAAYDFSKFGTLVDVGGATGHLLTTVLGRYPGLRGVLFDMPYVERNARELIASRGLSDRISISTGSFFDAVPPGGDAYLLSHIIHDWTEEQCLKILGNCRKVMKPDGKLLIVEMVLPPGNTMHPGKILDMIMLVGPGGQERTEEEYRELLGKAGFRQTRVVPTESAVSVVEGVLA
ncbi:MAG TPA: methyltransferase [Steroidobacteraceae bacterium]|nr:methyltransferase [Steroidobacteraceae bacterium]